MRSAVWAVLGAGLLVCAGCSTTRGASASLESRVQTLENRIQVLEADVQATTSPSGETMSAPKSADAATVETLTKKQIQEALKNAGYYDGATDGKIGPKTKAAIMDFQKDNGLKVDGVAGRNTKEKLLKYLQ
jgi:peptidoglycan hydrolase-like protein with peptidoglycan-binding domain